MLLKGDDPLLREIKDDMSCQTLTFGIDEVCDFQGSDVQCGEQGMEFDCTHNGETVHVVMDVLGKHNEGMHWRESQMHISSGFRWQQPKRLSNILKDRDSGSFVWRIDIRSLMILIMQARIR